MTMPSSITLNEVGPREGFQFEGIGRPDKIATADKVRLVEMLADTGIADPHPAPPHPAPAEPPIEAGSASARG